MSDVPDGFEKPRRRMPDLKWLAIPALAAAIFAFIMVKVLAAKKENDRTESREMFQRFERDLRAHPPATVPAPAAPVPGADRDQVKEVAGGLVERRFAGLVFRHPAEWRVQPSDNPLGRSIALGAPASAVSLLVVTGMTTDEVLSGIAGNITLTGHVDRAIAGTVRSGRTGTMNAMGRTFSCELFAFSLGPYTVAVLWQYDADLAKAAAGDLDGLTALSPAD